MSIGFVRRTTKQLKSIEFSSVSVPRGHIPDHNQEGSGRGQKRAGLDLAQKLPSCVKGVNKKWITLGSRRESEEGPRARPRKASTNRSKTKSERRTLSDRTMTKSV